MMGLDAEQFTPYRVTVFNTVYDQLNHPRPGPDADEAALYEHALLFLDRLLRNLPSEAWNCGTALTPSLWSGPSAASKTRRPRTSAPNSGIRPSTVPARVPWTRNHTNAVRTLDFFEDETEDHEPDFDFLAEKTHLPTAFLESVGPPAGQGQIILQGPPGTGRPT